MTPPYEKIDIAATAGDVLLLTGVAGRFHNINRVILTFTSADAVSTMTIQFKSGTTELTGPMTITNPGELIYDYVSQNPWHIVALGEDFIVNISNDAQISGMLYYTAT